MAFQNKTDITEKEWNDLVPSNEKKEKEDKKVNKSALRTLCNVFIVVGFVLLVLAVMLLLSGKSYFTQSACCFVGCVSLLFYGYVGKCLDDIRSNTKK